MNKSTIAFKLVTLLLLFTSCKEESKNSSTINNKWMQEIELNEGNKWTANPETNTGVAKMQEVLTTNTPKDLKDYYDIAEILNKEKNYIIKKCTMKGTSHDNLHMWLLPLIEKIDALKEVKTLDDALLIYKSIEQNINAYDMYFE